MRLRLALANLCLVLATSCVALGLAPAAAAAEYPLPVSVPPVEAPPEAPPEDPPPGTPDQIESEDEEEEEEAVDTRELKPVPPRERKVEGRTATGTKDKKKADRKPARPRGKKVQGDKACEFRVPLYEHEVIEGDMLSSIAARYGVRLGDVQRLNPKAKVLRIGQKIKVCPEIAPRLREEFTYTVKSGDSLSKIGEKYGLLVKEIVGLQKGSLRRRLDGDRSALRPGDELTLVVDRGVLPEFAPRDEDRGTLKVGVQLLPGKAYFIKRPHLAYGTSHSVKAIKAALSRYKQTKAGKGGPQVHVGDISARGGGALRGHKSHQKGIDVDIGLVLKGSDANETRFRTGNAGNLDIARTWALIKAFVDTADVRAVFLDYGLQKLLYEHARKQKVSESTLDVLFQYPRGRGRNFGIIRHWKGHKDHFHVRFKR